MVLCWCFECEWYVIVSMSASVMSIERSCEGMCV